MMHLQHKNDSYGRYDQLDEDVEEGTLVPTRPVIAPFGCSPYRIEVVAPATLREGYTFEVRHEESNRVVQVTVPKGGVTKGQRFPASLCADWIEAEHNRRLQHRIQGHRDMSSRSANTELVAGSPSQASENWADRTCDCLRKVSCPAIRKALCFPLALTLRIMNSLRLSWCGRQWNSPTETKRTFWVVFFAFLSTTVFNIILTTFIFNLTLIVKDSGVRSYNAQGLFTPRTLLHVLDFVRILNYSLALYSCYIMAKIRFFIRQMEAASDSSRTCPGSMEDFYAFFFHCGSSSQMTLQTEDDDSSYDACCAGLVLLEHMPTIL